MQKCEVEPKGKKPNQLLKDIKDKKRDKNNKTMAMA